MDFEDDNPISKMAKPVLDALMKKQLAIKTIPRYRIVKNIKEGIVEVSGNHKETVKKEILDLIQFAKKKLK